MEIENNEATIKSNSAYTPLFVLAFVTLFLSSKYFLGGLERPHWLFALAIFAAFYLSRFTRQFLIISLPVILYATIYDFLRYIPFAWFKPIHVVGPYVWDQWLAGIHYEGSLLSLNQWLYKVFQSNFFDFFSGAIYFLHIPVVLAMIFLLWKKCTRLEAQSYTMAFLIINLMAFATYVFFPVAPPWYVEKFGLVQPLHPVLGDAAGLVAFDQLLGINLYTDSYKLGAVTFGAIPSMHAGFATLVWFYSFKLGKKWVGLIGAYILSMYFSALYSQHHYLIDVLFGILYALVAWYLTDRFLSKFFKRVYDRLWNYFLPD